MNENVKKLGFGVALVVILAFHADAQQYCNESDFRIQSINRGRSVRITEYIGNNAEVRIPPRINNLPVTQIGRNAFARRNLISVTIPDNSTFTQNT